MTGPVIDRINTLGRADGQPSLLTFGDRFGRPNGDIVDDNETTGVDDHVDVHENDSLDFCEDINPNRQYIAHVPDNDAMIDRENRHEPLNRTLIVELK